jgi:hypothetical protein
MDVVNNNFTTYDGKAFHFEDYTNWKILVREIRKVNYLVREEFTDDDFQKFNVREEIVEGIVEDKYPSIFIFDFNENFIYEKDEVLIDEKADGINGNEIWLKDFELRMNYPKI